MQQCPRRPDVNAIYELPFDFPQKFPRVCCHIASFAHILGRDIFPLYPFINNSLVCQVWWNVWNIWLCIELVDLHSAELIACDPSTLCLIVGGTAANINGAPQFPAGSSTPVTSASQKGRCACAISFTIP